MRTRLASADGSGAGSASARRMRGVQSSMRKRWYSKQHAAARWRREWLQRAWTHLRQGCRRRLCAQRRRKQQATAVMLLHLQQRQMHWTRLHALLLQWRVHRWLQRSQVTPAGTATPSGSLWMAAHRRRRRRRRQHQMQVAPLLLMTLIQLLPQRVQRLRAATHAPAACATWPMTSISCLQAR